MDLDPGLSTGAVIVILLILLIILKTCCPDCFNTAPGRSTSSRRANSIISDNESFNSDDSSGDYFNNSGRRYPGYRVENERGRPRPYLISHNYAYNNDSRVPSQQLHPLQPNGQPRAGSSGSRRSRSRTDSTTTKSQSGNKKRSKSQPRAQATNILDDVSYDIDKMINGLQSNLAQDTSLNKSESIAEAQRLLLLRPFNNLELLAEECPMIIGVDATPATLAGYIVILKERRLEYYVIKRKDLPWRLHDEKDPSEFEMKNFMFALTVWKEIILKYRRLAIYTDNFAITQAKQFDENNYGKRASKLLSHYIKCERVIVVNRNNMAVNKNKKLKHFAMYLQPADDLSRWQISTAVKFLTDLYGIDQENVQGTHCLAWSGPTSAQARYKPTARHTEIIDHANDIIDCHDCPNPACSGTDLLYASLRSNR